jgi:hypothetical protein
MTYKPNFNDPRVKRKCLTALEFVEQYIFYQAKPIAQSQIHKHFGRSNDRLGAYLKQQLLICTDPHWNMLTGKCKKYIRNRDGYNELKKHLGITSDIISPKLEQQITTGEFEYTERSDRLFNPLQYKPATIRNKELAERGYCYDYDIDNAAATLLYQYAQITAKRDKNFLILPHIERYLTEKDAIRHLIAEDCGCDIKLVKKTLSGLFQGAYLSHSDKTHLYHELGANHTLIEKLKEHHYVRELREELKSMWKIIRGELKQIKQGRITGRDKAALYRRLEKEVMGVIWRELKRANISHLKIHDGWTSKELCDTKLLADKVRNKTGYQIRINWAIIAKQY